LGREDVPKGSGFFSLPTYKKSAAARKELMRRFHLAKKTIRKDSGQLIFQSNQATSRSLTFSLLIYRF